MKPTLGRRDGCVPYTIAHEGVFQIQRCAHCGTLAVHLGAVTLRFDAATLECVWNVVGQALARVHADGQREDNRERASRVGQA
jgi:hypothetical protein